MPPRPRREPPDRRDTRIHKHLQIAADYWGKCPRYRDEGDLLCKQRRRVQYNSVNCG